MKGVILAGGMGSRFLPITKVIPKEMLPLGGVPILEHIVNELVSSGINEILIVTSKQKKCIRNYFTHNKVMENFFIDRNRPDLLGQITYQNKLAKIYFVNQPYPNGTQDAVSYAQDFVGNDYFLLCNGDDVFVSKGNSCAKQLINAHKKYKCSILASLTLTQKELSNYGVIKYKDSNANYIQSIIEKPTSFFPSNDISAGRYVLSPEIFKYVQTNTVTLPNGEKNFVECLNSLAKNQKLVACHIKGKHFDTGTITGYKSAFNYFK